MPILHTLIMLRVEESVEPKSLLPSWTTQWDPLKKRGSGGRERTETKCEQRNHCKQMKKFKEISSNSLHSLTSNNQEQWWQNMQCNLEIGREIFVMCIKTCVWSDKKHTTPPKKKLRKGERPPSSTQTQNKVIRTIGLGIPVRVKHQASPDLCTLGEQRYKDRFELILQLKNNKTTSPTDGNFNEALSIMAETPVLRTVRSWV